MRGRLRPWVKTAIRCLFLVLESFCTQRLARFLRLASSLDGDCRQQRADSSFVKRLLFIILLHNGLRMQNVYEVVRSLTKRVKSSNKSLDWLQKPNKGGGSNKCNDIASVLLRRPEDKNCQKQEGLWHSGGASGDQLLSDVIDAVLSADI